MRRQGHPRVRRLLQSCVTLVALALVLTPGSISAAKLLANADSGLSERLFDTRSKAGNDDIIFFWELELARGRTDYAAGGECDRVNQFGEFVGNHRVVLKNVSLIGVDSGNEIRLPRQNRRLRNGLQNSIFFWDITPEVVSFFDEDEFVVAQARVFVSKRVAALNFLSCIFGVVEIDMGTAQASSSGERQQLMREKVRLLLPRRRAP